MGTCLLSFSCAPVGDAVRVQKVEAAGNVLQDAATLPVPPKLPHRVVPNSFLQITACKVWVILKRVNSISITWCATFSRSLWLRIRSDSHLSKRPSATRTSRLAGHTADITSVSVSIIESITQSAHLQSQIACFHRRAASGRFQRDVRMEGAPSIYSSTSMRLSSAKQAP